MKIEIDKTELLRAASIASAACTDISTIPILSNVLMIASQDGLELRAGGFNMRTKVNADAAILEHGEITVPARTLFDLAKNIRADKVIIASNGTCVTVEAGSTIAKLASMPAMDYPSWPVLADAKTLNISGKALRRIIDAVIPFVPHSDPRKVLQSVCLDVSPESIIAVATDGKILSRLTTLEPTGIEDQILVPVFLLQHIGKLLETESDVTVEIDSRQIAITIDGTVSIANRVDGTYPNYSAVIPRDFGVEIEFSRSAMITAVKSAMVLVDRVNLHVDLSFSHGQCQIQTDNHDLGQYTDTIGANVQQDFDLCVNGKYWLAALSALTADTVTLRANQPTTPVILEGPETDPYILVMPIKKTEVREPAPEEEEVPA